MKDVMIDPKYFKHIGPVADPAPPFRIIWEDLVKEQQLEILVRGIDRKIRQVEFDLKTMTLELEELKNAKSMIKEMGR